MKKVAQTLVLLIASTAVSAGDLVLKLGTTGAPVYHRIPVTGNVTISPASGDIFVDPVAEQGVGNDGWCPSDNPPNGPVFTQNLTVSTSSLPAGGGSVTLTWAVTNATSCSGSASPSVSGWNGSVASPTTVNLTASGTYTFSLSCSNGQGTTQSTPRTVTVATDSACGARPAPAGLTRQTMMINNPRFPENFEWALNENISLTGYSPIFGATFPQIGQRAYVFIDTSKYVAMEFSTGSLATGVYGSIEWEQPSVSGAPMWAMISPCPGDFEFQTDSRCKAYGGIGSLDWVIGPGAPSHYCHLDPNKTYYVNAIFSSSDSYTTTSCGGSKCYWFVIGAGQTSFQAAPDLGRSGQ